LPDDKQHLRASVLYNLSLAYARKQDLAAAVKTLESIAPVEHAGLMRKVQSLLARARGATASGKDLQLFTDAAPAAPALVSDDTSKLIRQFKGVSPRDVTACCYGVHIDDRPEEDLVKALLATVPSFKTRDVIVKG
jgi:hypothetical protein